MMFRRTTLQPPREATPFLKRIEQTQTADFYNDFGKSVVTVLALALIENGLPVDAKNLLHAIETKGASLPVRTYRAELQEELNRIQAHNGEHFSVLIVSTLSAIRGSNEQVKR